MKKSTRIASSLLLTAIYCCVIAIVTLSFGDINSQNTPNSEQEKYSATVSNNLLYHNIESENSISNFTNLSKPNLKEPSNILWAISIQTEKLVKAEFLQYTKLSRSFLILYRKTDIIFPSHYFW